MSMHDTRARRHPSPAKLAQFECDPAEHGLAASCEQQRRRPRSARSVRSARRRMTSSVGARRSARGHRPQTQGVTLRPTRADPASVHPTQVARGSAHHVLLVSSSTHNKDTTMTTMIQNEHANRFESIDLSRLSAITGGKGTEKKPNFLQRWGENMTKGGEYALAA